MAYDFLLTGWENNVRGVCGGVSSTDVPDSLLALDAYGTASEDLIKELVSTWETLKVTLPSTFNRAAYYHVASKVCSYLKVKLLGSEKIGADYSYTLQKIDWDKLAMEALAMFYHYLGLIDPECVETLTVIDIAERTPPVYGELIVEEISGLL